MRAARLLSAGLRLQLVSVLLKLDEREAAIHELDRAVSCHPLSERAYARRAEALADDGRWLLALQDAVRAIRLAKRSPEIYQNLYDVILKRSGIDPRNLPETLRRHPEAVG